MADTLQDKIPSLPSKGSPGQLAGRALVFAAITYILFSVQAGVAQQSITFLSPLRILSCSAGAILFWIAASRFQTSPRLSRHFVFSLLLASSSAAALLFILREVCGPLLGESFPLGYNARWALAWGGYFAAAIAIHMAGSPGKPDVPYGDYFLNLGTPPARTTAGVLSPPNLEAWAWLIDALSIEISKAPDGARDRLMDKLNRDAGIRTKAGAVGGVTAHTARLDLIERINARVSEVDEEQVELSF